MHRRKNARVTAFLLPVLLVLARFAAMALLALGLAFVVNHIAERWLLPATSFDETFDRLGRSVAAGALAGVLLGGGLTCRLGRRRYGLTARLVFTAVAAAPLLFVATVAALG